MMKRYKVGNNYYWYNEGDQPSNAILAEKKAESKKETEAETDVEIKVRVPKNKSKGVKAK